MKSKLIRINEKEFRAYFDDSFILSYIKSKKESVLKLVEFKPSHNERIDPLLDLEISLRKCDRLGVFRK